MNSPHALIFLSGGKGSRFGSPLPKQYQTLQGVPLVLFSFLTFLKHGAFNQFVVVAEEEWHPLFKENFEKWKKEGQGLIFAKPGFRRQDSLKNGFDTLTPFEGLVAIHDGARPFVSEALIDRTLEGAKTEGAAAPALPLSFTVKRVSSLEKVEETVDQSCLREIQTPQILSYILLKEGLQKKGEVTDDLSLVEKLGMQPTLVLGERSNLKITYPEDLELAEWILKKRSY